MELLIEDLKKEFIAGKTYDGRDVINSILICIQKITSIYQKVADVTLRNKESQNPTADSHLKESKGDNSQASHTQKDMNVTSRNDEVQIILTIDHNKNNRESFNHTCDHVYAKCDVTMVQESDREIKLTQSNDSDNFTAEYNVSEEVNYIAGERLNQVCEETNSDKLRNKIECFKKLACDKECEKQLVVLESEKEMNSTQVKCSERRIMIHHEYEGESAENEVKDDDDDDDGKDDLRESELLQTDEVTSGKKDTVRINTVEIIRTMRSINSTDERPYKCSVCNRGFRRSDKLNCHMRIHTNEKPFKCKYCDKHFVERSNQKRHQWIHFEDKPFKCEICLQQFLRSTELELHMTKHNGTEPFLCQVCGKGFTRNYALKAHLLTHSTDKPFKCEICDKNFSSIQSLKKHVYNHSRKKRHKCTICDKSFTIKKDCQNHNNNHIHELTSETQDGDGCDWLKGFPLPQTSYLEKRQEIADQHPSVLNIDPLGRVNRTRMFQNHKCPFCTKTYVKKSALETHVLINCKNYTLKCRTCQQFFSSTADLKQHQTIHKYCEVKKPYICQECGKAFRQPHMLKIHFRIHTGEKNYVCDICGVNFCSPKSLKRHLNIHNGIMPYLCNLCGDSFYANRDLQRHLKRHNGDKVT